jgi:hypothetical protein
MVSDPRFRPDSFGGLLLSTVKRCYGALRQNRNYNSYTSAILAAFYVQSKQKQDSPDVEFTNYLPHPDEWDRNAAKAKRQFNVSDIVAREVLNSYDDLPYQAQSDLRQHLRELRLAATGE